MHILVTAKGSYRWFQYRCFNTRYRTLHEGVISRNVQHGRRCLMTHSACHVPVGDINRSHQFKFFRRFGPVSDANCFPQQFFLSYTGWQDQRVYWPVVSLQRPSTRSSCPWLPAPPVPGLMPTRGNHSSLFAKSMSRLCTYGT